MNKRYFALAVIFSLQASIFAMEERNEENTEQISGKKNKIRQEIQLKYVKADEVGPVIWSYVYKFAVVYSDEETNTITVEGDPKKVEEIINCIKSDIDVDPDQKKSSNNIEPDQKN